MAKKYLLTHSEQLATNIELLCQNINSCYSIQTALMKQPIKIIEIFAVASDEC